MNTTLKLFSDRLEQHLACGGDSATEHDPVHADKHHHVAHADPQVAARVAQPLLGAQVTRPRGRDRLFDAGLSARTGNGVGPSQSLEAAAVAAAASRPVGKDGLMAELARGALVAEVKTPVEDQPSSDPGAERDPEHRRRAAPCAQAVFGQREGARVVDQAAPRPDRTADLIGHVHPVPVPGDVGNESGHTRGGVEDAWHADSDRFDPIEVAKDAARDIAQLPDHALLAFVRVGRQPAGFQKARLHVALDDSPLQIRPAHVETEVTRHSALIVPLMIVTVLGPIPPGELGVTDAHDHLFLRSPALPGQEFDDAGKAAEEVRSAVRSGVQSIVEVTPIGLGRRPAKLRAVAEATGAHIVAATGYHRDAHYEEGHWVRDATVEVLAERILTDLKQGMHPQDWLSEAPLDSACAGVIKAGASYQHISVLEERRLIAAAAGSRETGAPILVHTEIGTCGHEIIDFLTREGVKPDRIILAHLDRNPDLELHASIADRGVTLEYDTPGRIKYRADSQLLDLIEGMVRAGHGDAVMLGLDLGQRDYFRSYGGGPGLSYLMNTFVPRLRNRLGEAAVRKILVDTPARAFAMAAI